MSHNIHRNPPRLSTPSDARAVRTRESLRQALLGLLETMPFDKISIRDIARTADIGYRTFFRHHPTKESVLHEVAADEIQSLLQLALPVVVAGNNRAGAMTLCTFVHEHRKLWSTLLTGGAAGTMREEFIRLASTIAVEEPDDAQWLPADIGLILAISSIIELLAWWLRQHKPLSIERVAEILDRMIITPVVSADQTGAWLNARQGAAKPGRARSAGPPSRNRAARKAR